MTVRESAIGTRMIFDIFVMSRFSARARAAASHRDIATK
jgi:hypothetical protein